MSEFNEAAQVLRAMHPGAYVEEAEDAALQRIFIPSARLPHDYVVIAVQDVGEQGWRMFDAGTLPRLESSDLDELVDLLGCAGAELEVADGVATAYSERSPESLARRALEMAHYLQAAPIVWHARLCLMEESDSQRPTSPVIELARYSRGRLVERYGAAAGAVLHVGRYLAGAGERAKAPLIVAGPHRASSPTLIASFLDFTTSELSRAHAKRSTTWLFEVVRDLHAQRVVGVKGASDSELEHLAETLAYERLFDYGDGRAAGCRRDRSHRRGGLRHLRRGGRGSRGDGERLGGPAGGGGC